MKKTFILMTFSLLTLTACNPETQKGGDSGHNNTDNSNMIACTQDAKICPDGTGVGRDPTNNCEFKPCPNEKQ
jgi:hypothetical protein